MKIGVMLACPILLFILANAWASVSYIPSTITLNQLPEEIEFTVKNDSNHLQVLSIDYFAPVEYEIAGTAPATLAAGAEREITLRIIPDNGLLNVEQYTTLAVSVGSERKTIGITLKFEALRECPVNFSFVTAGEKGEISVGVNMDNISAEDVNVALKRINSLPAGWNFSPENKEVKVQAGETAVQNYKITPLGAFDGNAVLVFSCGSFEKAISLPLEYSSKEGATGYAGFIPEIDLGLVADIVLAVAAAILFIALAARIKHRIKGKRKVGNEGFGKGSSAGKESEKMKGLKGKKMVGK